MTVETILARWAYVSTVYNSLVLPKYREIDIQPNFGALQDSLKQIVKGTKDGLLRLKKIEKILPASLVASTLPQQRLNKSKFLSFPELNHHAVSAYIILFEVLFCNAMIIRALITESNVTKTLNIALQLIGTGEVRLGLLQHAFAQLPFGIASQVEALVKEVALLYTVCKLLTVYLLNKMQLDSPLSQTREKRFLRRENYLLAKEINFRTNHPATNPNGPYSNPFLRLLLTKHLKEAWAFAEQYEKTELHNADPEVLAISMDTITGRHIFEYNPLEDILRQSIEAELNG